MIDYTNIRNRMISGLYSFIGSPVVPAEQRGPKPPYPYLTYKFISLYIPETGYKAVSQELVASPDPLFNVDILQTHTDQPLMVISLTAISRDDLQAAELIQKARDWFTVNGYDYLKAENIVTVDATPTRDRHSLLIDDYDRKYGFDVRIRVLDQTDVTTTTIEHTHISN